MAILVWKIARKSETKQMNMREIAMKKRALRKSLLRSVSALSLLTLERLSAAQARRDRGETLLQSSMVAGFQFYDGKLVWDELRKDDVLRLILDPENQHDEQAVKVMWGDHQLGYVPSSENTAIYQMLSRNQPLTARICELHLSSNPWEQIRTNIYMVQV